jgi:hypothetical protein
MEDVEMIKETIRKILRIPKREVYVTPTPDVLELNRRLMQENAELRAELAKTRLKKEDKRLEKERLKQEKQEKKILKKYKKEKIKEEKFKGIMLPLKTKKLPTFFLKSNIPYGKFKGFYLKETKDGQVLWYPLLLNNKKLTIPKGRDASVLNPALIFRSKLGIVSQLRGGKVDSNYDIIINEDGSEELTLFIPKYKEKGKNVKIIDISETERNEYEKKLKHYELAYKELAQELQKIKDREINYETESAKNEVELASAVKERDIWAANSVLLAKRQVEMIKTISDTLSGIQDLKVSSVLTEDLNRRLLRILSESRDIMERYLPKEVSEVERERLKETIGIAKELETRVIQPPPAKEEEKK